MIEQLHLFNIQQRCDIKSLNLDTLATLPGFIYIKSMSSVYLWTNYNLSRAATGIEAVDAIKGGTDFDFCWKTYAESMKKNDQKVIKQNTLIHAIETSQRRDGIVRRLTTCKVPLYEANKVIGVLGISTEQPINSYHERLTPREQSCIALMAEGLVDKEIAVKLGISRRTVETHFNSSKIKLNVHTRAELIVLFCGQS